MINWQDVAAFAALVGMMVSAATVYLRLYVGNQMLEFRKSVSDHYATKRTVHRKFRAHEQRLNDHAERINHLETSTQ